MKITAELARAAGTDAGSRHMSAHTLKAWSHEAYSVAARTTNRLLMHVPVEDGGLKGLQLTAEHRAELGLELERGTPHV